MKTCRACLTIDKDLFQVDEHFISSYNLLTNLNVKLYDSMPKRFCRACMESVTFFIEFRDKCISSESTLQAKSLNFKVECDIEIHEKEADDNLETNCQLEGSSVKDEITEEECVELENSPFVENEINPLELEDVKKPRGKKPRKQSLERVKIDDNIDNTTDIQGKKPRKKKPKKAVNIDDFFCGLCEESFIILDDLNIHLDNHKTDGRCGICSKEFENWPKLLAHRTIHSSGKYCHLCPRRFASILKLEQHYFDAHFKEKLEEMCCEHCQKTFTCPEKFSTHKETHNVECEICSEMFINRYVLKVHMRTHKSKKLYQCDQCEYTAIYADVLTNHKNRRHAKYSCTTCNRKFAKQTSIKMHTCKVKHQVCPVCGKRIYESFNRHMRSHQEERVFKCDKCSASFKYSISLKVHMDRHDNNPSYECEYCGRKFYNSTILTKHRRTHTGEKPYVCKLCGKAFTGSFNLKMHMRVHGLDVIKKKVSED